MTTARQGRFCDHCQKTVIDFTTWSDGALYSFFSKNNGHICGRFLGSQLDRPIHIPYQPHSRLYRLTVAMGLTLLFTQTPHLLAQNRPPMTAQAVPTKGDDNKDSIAHPTGVIKGVVLDDKKQPLPSAAIQVYQAGILKGGNITDFDGNYTIGPLEPGNYDLLVLYPGYDSLQEKSIVVSKGDTTTKNFQMKQNQNHIEKAQTKFFMGYKIPLIDPDKRIYSRDEIDQMPIR